jgi:hypothetical protein
MTLISRRSIAFGLLRAGLVLSLAIGTAGTVVAQRTSVLSQYVSAEAPPAFEQTTQAVDAFKTALKNSDFDGLTKLLGLDPAKLKTSDGAMDTFAKMRDAATTRLIVKDKGSQSILELGDELWPMPFPLSKTQDGKWAFDTQAGIDEIMARRIGENEDQAIATVRAYVDAQNEYATADHDGDGVLESARKLISTPGKTDGLYWPPDQGDGDSPAGAIPDSAQLQGAKPGQGYFGYHFRILTGQGANIAGGRHDYIINGNMIAGFGLIAWPVTYGETGVQTFVVSKDGIVYQADLGPATAEKAADIRLFNPGNDWEIVKD